MNDDSNRDLFAEENNTPLNRDPEVGDVLGPYRLDKEIGRGSQGLVFAATRLSDQRRFALKVLREKYNDDSQMYLRFYKEAQATARVKHPNIVEVYAIRNHRGVVYYPMEFLVGETLAARVRRSPAMSVREVADMAVPVAMALVTIHRAGLVHRDIKPANLFLVTASDGTTAPKILDFGIVKELDPERMTQMTIHNILLGTPIYMSPEQWEDPSNVTARSDQFSFGAILHECFTGQRLFKGKSPNEVRAQIFGGGVTPLNDAVAAVPAEIARTVRRMLERDPAQRFATLLDVARAFLPYASETVKADFALDLTDTVPLLVPEKSVHTSQFEYALLVPSEGHAPLTPLDALVTAWNSIPKGVPMMRPRDPRAEDDRGYLWFFWAAAVAGVFVALVSVGGHRDPSLIASIHTTRPVPLRPSYPRQPIAEDIPAQGHQPVDAGRRDVFVVPTAPPHDAPSLHAPSGVRTVAPTPARPPLPVPHRGSRCRPGSLECPP